MLSLACYRIASRNRLVVRRLQQRRAWLTTDAVTAVTATVTTKTTKTIHKKKPLVISRRAWNEFKESRGITKKPTGSSKSNSSEENPWPRNFQIAGYVAGTFLVPYMMLWTITSNPTLREWFGPYLPLDKLRTHYGEPEWDAQSYSEELEQMKNKENQTGNDDDSASPNVQFYQFPQEAPFRERQQQEIIKIMEESDVKITLSLSSSSEEATTKTVAAKTIFNAKNLLNFIPSASASSTMNQNQMVAVDFIDDEKNDIINGNKDNNNNNRTDGGFAIVESISDDGALMTDAESMSKDNVDTTRTNQSSSSSLSDFSADRILAKETQTMSKWSYMPPQPSQAVQKETAAKSSQRSTDVEMNIARLEYDITELSKNLRDPLCTRDMDDMQHELRQSKRELSKLKWKRRLGLAR
jgi:hypothetical protein